MNEVLFVARNEGQRQLRALWRNSRLVFLIGPAGTGKTHAALALALEDLFGHRAEKVILTRPNVALDGDEIGFTPGGVNEKMIPWLGPFTDVLPQMTHAKFNPLIESGQIEPLPLAYARGRTVRKATLIADEAQNLSVSQIKCLATRVGERGRVVLCGDPQQSDRYRERSPLLGAAKKLADVPGVVTIRFTTADVVRDPFVRDVLEAFNA
jgi:phosphate starvation-inducible PhoH-like protein